MLDRIVEATCFCIAVLVLVFAVVWAFTEAASIETSRQQMPRFSRVAS